MRFRRRFRFSIPIKVLALALVLAWPPLIAVSWLGVSSLDRAYRSAVGSATESLRMEAEANMAKRASDKASLYNTALRGVQDQVEDVAAYARVLIDAGPPEASTARVWVSPDGPTPASQQVHADAVARARQFVPLLNSVVRNSSLVSLGYIALEDGGVTAFDHDIVDVLDRLKPFDVRERPWYVAAREAGQTVWVDTYIDANTKEPVVTCATPLYDSRGQFVGVVGFDMPLDTIQQDVLQLDMGDGGYAFLINGSGQVLVRPDMQLANATWDEPFTSENLLLSEDATLRVVVERMTRSQQGVERLMYEGTAVYLAYAPIENAGWSVGMVIPESEIVRAAQDIGAGVSLRQSQLRTQVLALVVLSVIAVPIAGVVLSLLLARPLRRLNTGAQRIAAGDLSHQIAVSSDDEIGDLGRSFNAMTVSLRQKVAELEENLRQFATLNEASNRFRAILSLPHLLDQIPSAVCRDFGFDRAVLYLLDGRQLRAVSASFGEGAEQQAAAFLAAANAEPILVDGETVEADIVRTGQAVIVDNPWDHPRVLQGKQQIARSEAYVQAPIFGREKNVIGLLSADYFYQRKPIAARDAAQLLTFASMVGLTIENTRLYDGLERQVAQRTTELRAALVRAQEADRLKGQFLAAISHELRTPLNAIIGFSTVLLDELDGPLTPLQREDLRTINQNGRFLLHLINELLDLAKIEAGKLELALESTDLGKLISEVADTVQGLLYGKPVALRVKLPPHLPKARVDQAKVRQILLNLLANAVKFTEQGEITVAARSVVMAEDDLNLISLANPAEGTNGEGPPTWLRPDRRMALYVALSISDTGIGIPPDQLPLIFEEFRQAHGGRAGSRGSGLGLAITRRLVEAHRGRIWVESVPGQGSTFTFVLPVDGQSASPAPAPAAGDGQRALAAPAARPGRHSTSGSV